MFEVSAACDFHISSISTARILFGSLDHLCEQSYKGGARAFPIDRVSESTASESLTSYTGLGRLERLRQSSEQYSVTARL
jgi:hypothetical protein